MEIKDRRDVHVITNKKNIVNHEQKENKKK